MAEPTYGLQNCYSDSLASVVGSWKTPHFTNGQWVIAGVYVRDPAKIAELNEKYGKNGKVPAPVPGRTL